MPFADELANRVTVVAYDLSWPADFRALARRLAAGVGSTARGIDHIGSTSVPGLAAKDCIDVQVRVDSLDEAPIASLFTNLGFRRRPEPWNQVENTGGRQWPKLVFAPPIGERAANVHVRESGSATARRNLLFRDFLRADEPARVAWGSFKQRLAQTAADLYDYGQIKQPATDVLMIAAENWARRAAWIDPSR
ncbi:MAG: GrpB family protein [Pseudonocardiaceae bacterium]